MRKLATLLLAFVMIVSTSFSVFATTPSTKVYLDFDFGQFVADKSATEGSASDRDTLIKYFNGDGGNLGTRGNVTTPIIRNAFNTYSRQGFITQDGYGVTNARCSIYKNENGDWMFVDPNSDVMNTSYYTGAMYYIAPTEEWTMVPGETLIISYDTEILPYSNTAYTATPSNGGVIGNAVFWQNEDGTKYLSDDQVGFSFDGVSTHKVIFAGGYSNTRAFEVPANKTFRLALGYKQHTDNGGVAGAERTFAERHYAINGESQWIVNTTNGANGHTGVAVGNNGQYGAGTVLSDVNKISAIRMSSFYGNYRVGRAYGNIRMYSVKDGEFATSMIGETANLPTSSEYITVKFNNPITRDGFTNAAFAVTEKIGDGSPTPFSAYKSGEVKTIVEGNEIYSTAKIYFPNGLSANAEYVVTFDNVKNEIGYTPNPLTNSVTFTTAAPPAFETTLSANSGLIGDGSPVTTLTSGTQARFTATGTNSESTGNSSYLFIGFYDSFGNILSYSFAKSDYAANGADVISMAGKITSDVAEVKAFNCGNLFNLQSFTASPGSIED